MQGEWRAPPPPYSDASQPTSPFVMDGYTGIARLGDPYKALASNNFPQLFTLTVMSEVRSISTDCVMYLTCHPLVLTV